MWTRSRTSPATEPSNKMSNGRGPAPSLYNYLDRVDGPASGVVLCTLSRVQDGRRRKPWDDW